MTHKATLDAYFTTLIVQNYNENAGFGDPEDVRDPLAEKHGLNLFWHSGHQKNFSAIYSYIFEFKGALLYHLGQTFICLLLRYVIVK